MSGWINGTLDELAARLRELKREVARREQGMAWYQDQVSWPEDCGLGRVHDSKGTGVNSCARARASRSTMRRESGR